MAAFMSLGLIACGDKEEDTAVVEDAGVVEESDAGGAPGDAGMPEDTATEETDGGTSDE